MFLQKLRELNVKRCEEAFHHPIDSWSIMEWGCAIGGEAGELLNVLKKIQRADQGIGGRDVSRIEGNEQDAIGDEAADIVIYLDLLCAREGIDLQQHIARKFNKDSVKVGFKEPL